MKRSKLINGRVSPPPLKRPRRTSNTASTQPHEWSTALDNKSSALAPGSLRIFSWNVNGIAPFVQDYLQKPITTFFNSSPTAVKKRQVDDNDGGDDIVKSEMAEGTSAVPNMEDSAKEGEPSLRATLRRFRWPHILFLQEVKIKAGDAKTMAAVRAAVNDAGGLPASGKEWVDNQNQHEEISISEGERINGLLEDGGPQYDMHFNLPADLRNARGFGGKLYGVAAIIRKDFAHRYVQSIREVPWDREGRVQIIETKEMSFPVTTALALISSSTLGETKPNVDQQHEYEAPGSGTKFALINIYAVNGTSNPYYNTCTGVKVGTRHDRKQAVHTELLFESHDLQRSGFQVVIAGDLNVARDKIDGHPNLRTFPHQHVLNRLDFNTKFFTNKVIAETSSKARFPRESAPSKKELIEGFNGIDTFRRIHKSERRYSYYPRNRPWGASCDRVDLIIASRSLVDSVTGAGICDNPRDRGPSDHCPIWVMIGNPMPVRGIPLRKNLA